MHVFKVWAKKLKNVTVLPIFIKNNSKHIATYAKLAVSVYKLLLSGFMFIRNIKLQFMLIILWITLNARKLFEIQKHWTWRSARTLYNRYIRAPEHVRTISYILCSYARGTVTQRPGHRFPSPHGCVASYEHTERNSETHIRLWELVVNHSFTETTYLGAALID